MDLQPLDKLGGFLSVHASHCPEGKFPISFGLLLSRSTEVPPRQILEMENSHLASIEPPFPRVSNQAAI
jgi:hypothetical protein